MWSFSTFHSSAVVPERRGRQSWSKCDRLNQKIENTIVAMIPGNISQIGKEPTQFLIEPKTPAGASSGLELPSAERCQNLSTVAQGDIHATIGHLSDALMQKLDEGLKATLELP